MKEIFLKSVRKDGSSCWAPSGLGVVYEIGKHYTFPKHMPAHVFPVPISGLSEYAFHGRKERDGSSRVLICYGETEEREVPYLDVTDFWRVGNFCIDSMWILTSYDFDVIGEIMVPSAWIGYEDNLLSKSVSEEAMGMIESYGKKLLAYHEETL